MVALDPARVTITRRATLQRLLPVVYEIRLDGKVIEQRVTRITKQDALDLVRSRLDPAPAVRYIAPTRGPKPKGREAQGSDDDA